MPFALKNTACDERPDAKIAAGIVFVAPDGDVLLLRRSATEKNFGGHWGLPGGGGEEGETAYDAAIRECKEEIQFGIDAEAHGLKLLDRVDTPTGMQFSTFAKPVDDKFVPVLDAEHSGYCWASLDSLPGPLHPSVAKTLGEHIGAGADMTPEDWAGLRDGFVKWTREEEAEPDHSPQRAMDVRLAMDRRYDGQGRLGNDVLALDRKSVRTYSVDGHLHVSRTPISKANVCPYWGKEIPDFEALGLDPDRKYMLLRCPEELAKAAATSNGKQLVIEHQPVDADDPKMEITVGAVGTDAEFADPYLFNSLVVWDRVGIDGIEDESQRELSSGYRYRADMTPGEFKGVQYDGVMRDIVFNHVCLVKEGRAGADVLVGDSQLEEVFQMSKKVLTRFAGASVAALGVYLKPKLAADAKFDLNGLFADVTKANFAAKRPAILSAIKGAKLAKDASLDDVLPFLENLEKQEVQEGADIDPNSGLPMEAEAQAKMNKTADSDPMAQLRELLAGKLSAEDMAACDAIMNGANPAAGQDEDDEEAKKKKEAEAAAAGKDNKAPIDQKAMDAAIKANGDAVEKRIRAEMKAAAEAREFVRPWAGNLSMALDSAESIHRAALDSLSVEHKGIHPDALPAIIKAQPKPGEKHRTTIAQDAQVQDTSGFQGRWGDQAGRIALTS